VVVTAGAVSRAKLQSNRHHQQTNTQLFTGRMPFRLPSQHRQSTEGKIKCDNYLYGLILAPKMVQGVDLATLNHLHPVCWLNLFLASLPT